MPTSPRGGLLGALAVLAAIGAAGVDGHVVGARQPLGRPVALPRRAVPLEAARAAPSAVVEDLAARIVTGATQGAVGAFVAATLSAFTEPVVNRILVERITVSESIKRLDVGKSVQFFRTTLPTNFLKFPLFEAVNCVMEAVAVPDAVKGLVTGFLFTTLTLPITNYRFCKSMELPVDGGALFKAYLPTVLRDIAYGISRTKLNTALLLAYPALVGSTWGRAALLFPTVLLSCVLSSPGNELRGYYLQPKDKRLGFKAFFRPKNYARSTVAGALIMAISLSVGCLVTTPVKLLLSALQRLGAAADPEKPPYHLFMPGGGIWQRATGAAQ